MTYSSIFASSSHNKVNWQNADKIKQQKITHDAGTIAKPHVVEFKKDAAGAKQGSVTGLNSNVKEPQVVELQLLDADDKIKRRTKIVVNDGDI